MIQIFQNQLFYTLMKASLDWTTDVDIPCILQNLSWNVYQGRMRLQHHNRVIIDR